MIQYHMDILLYDEIVSKRYHYNSLSYLHSLMSYNDELALH